MATTVWAQANPTGVSGYATTTEDGSYGLYFTVATAGTLQGIWFYSPSGASSLPTSIALYSTTVADPSSGTLLASDSSPSWSGAAGSGWVQAAITATAVASGTYYVAQYYGADFEQGYIQGSGEPSAWFPTTSADGNITAITWIYSSVFCNGPYYNGSNTFPIGLNGLNINWLLDVEIVFPTTASALVGGDVVQRRGRPRRAVTRWTTTASGLLVPARRGVPEVGGFDRNVRRPVRVYVRWKAAPFLATGTPAVGGWVQRRRPVRAVWHGLDVPGLRSAPVTGGAIYRRVHARAVTLGAAAPFRQAIPATGGAVLRRVHSRAVIKTVTGPFPGTGTPATGGFCRRTRPPARALWRGAAGTAAVTQVAETGGFVARRREVRGFWEAKAAAFPATGTPATGGFIFRRHAVRGLGAGQRGAFHASGVATTGGAVLRRVHSRAVWRSAAGTIPAALALHYPTGGTVVRSAHPRAIWTGRGAGFLATGLPVVGGEICRRTHSRAVWRFAAGSGIATGVPAIGGFISRPRSARGAWERAAAPGVYGVPATGGKICRPAARRGIWHGLAVPGLRGAPVTGGAICRRTRQRGVWHGHGAGFPGPGSPVTGGCVVRRHFQPVFPCWRGTRPVGYNVIPVRGTVPPLIVVVPRRSIRAYWRGVTPVTGIAVATGSVYFMLGQPYLQWLTGPLEFQWLTGQPAGQWTAGPMSSGG